MAPRADGAAGSRELGRAGGRAHPCAHCAAPAPARCQAQAGMNNVCAEFTLLTSPAPHTMYGPRKPPYFCAAAAQHAGSSGIWGVLITEGWAAASAAIIRRFCAGSEAESSSRSDGSLRTCARTGSFARSDIILRKAEIKEGRGRGTCVEEAALVAIHRLAICARRLRRGESAQHYLLHLQPPPIGCDAFG